MDRLIEQTDLSKPEKRSWSLTHWGNRLAVSLIAAIAINVITGTAVGWVVGIVLFVLTTAIVTATRR